MPMGMRGLFLHSCRVLKGMRELSKRPQREVDSSYNG